MVHTRRITNFKKHFRKFIIITLVSLLIVPPGFVFDAMAQPWIPAQTGEITYLPSSYDSIIFLDSQITELEATAREVSYEYYKHCNDFFDKFADFAVVVSQNLDKLEASQFKEGLSNLSNDKEISKQSLGLRPYSWTV
jgi:hypothetical protein